MTASAASAEIEIPPVTVTPGGEATTTLTVRNDGDIVEAYTLETVGDCAAWSTVEPARVSLYPGTSETVTIRLAPPRAPEVRAGDIPLGVRVLPVEHPELVRVPETTVHVEAFRELRRELQPRRRRGWLGARYRVAVRNQGNTAGEIAFAGQQAGEELRFGFTPSRPRLEPGESTEVRLRVRTRKLIWFGKPVTWPFQVDVAHADETAAGERSDGRDRAAGEYATVAQQPPLEGEFVQLSVFPKWLLAVLAALVALLIAWFALVRPAVQSTAKQAVNDAVSKPSSSPSATQQGGTPGAGGGGQSKPAGGGGGAGSGGGGSSPAPGAVGGGQQSSATIDVQTDGGAKKTGVYKVPAGKVFGITDIVVANFQGDEGVLTITFGERKITTIALETFRNQDYHWVTPIEIPENATVTANVTCAKPGTPATGKQASGCDEVLNVSGVLSDVER
ncbi:COG1470 family protein [Streptomyces sp. NPDC055897]